LTENFSVIFDFRRLQKNKKEESSQAKSLPGVNFVLRPFGYAPLGFARDRQDKRA
jgi:hypothetical protein